MVVGSGKDDLRQRMLAGAIAFHQALDDRKAVKARHLHIEKDQVGVMLLDEIDCLDAVAAVSDDFNAAQRVEQVLQLFAGQLFVVDDQRGESHFDGTK